MSEVIWRGIARILAKPAIANAIIRYAQRTPYFHLPCDEDPSYMKRWWVFNRYRLDNGKPRFRWCPWSVRVHHILREDRERHIHDHPWNARTIILRGFYVEYRENAEFESMTPSNPSNPEFEVKLRQAGDTATLGHNRYHCIRQVSDGGVYTLFISGPWQGVWGFLVNGVKIPWRTYLRMESDE
ncbi:MAG: hypothetical protein ACREA9_21135 [Pyrinomonadaceae bacterium]